MQFLRDWFLSLLFVTMLYLIFELFEIFLKHHPSSSQISTKEKKVIFHRKIKEFIKSFLIKEIDTLKIPPIIYLPTQM